MNIAKVKSFAGFVCSHEGRWVCLLCFLAAVHVLVFSAAFPFFNILDERAHFDLLVKYSHGHVPRRIEPFGQEASEYILTYDSPEFLTPPKAYPGNRYPTPFWVHPDASGSNQQNAAFQRAALKWPNIKGIASWQNYESAQQPLYYVVAGLWWRLGQACGLTGLHLLYWVRFLNVPIIVLLVLVGYFAARLVFPGQFFTQIGVAAVLAFIPQEAFYSIESDVLSPLFFGIAFLCLIHFWRAETPGIGWGTATGLAMAATFLVKLSNAPLLAVAGIVLAIKTFRLARAKNLRAFLPSLALLFVCAALPIAAWLAWTKYAFGDFTGTAVKLHYLTWVRKPFAEWWHHPIFTPSGMWTFVSGLLVSFWQGEFWWHGFPLDLPVVDGFYVVPSLFIILLGFAALVPRFGVTTKTQRQTLIFCIACWLSTALFLGWISISYNFGSSLCPSQEFPYCTTGRLMLGALVPFLLFCFSGLNFLFRDVKNKWVRPVVLAAMVLFMLVSEIVTDWGVFQSQYNWYHS